jgi:hypothetical protein
MPMESSRRTDSTTTTTNSPVKHQFTVNMPPKKKVERGAQENIQLGPQVREVREAPSVSSSAD